MKLRDREGIKAEAIRFLLAGGINTLATLAIYWSLLPLAGYGPAYTAAYLAGLAISYLLNVAFVFQVRATARSALAFPLVYAAQYGAGLGILWLWSDVMHMAPAYGVIASIGLTVPLTFLMLRFVLRRL